MNKQELKDDAFTGKVHPEFKKQYQLLLADLRSYIFCVERKILLGKMTEEKSYVKIENAYGDFKVAVDKLYVKYHIPIPVHSTIESINVEQAPNDSETVSTYSLK